MTVSLVPKSAANLLKELKRDGHKLEAPIDIEAIVNNLGMKIKLDPSLTKEGIVSKIDFCPPKGNGALITISSEANRFDLKRRLVLAHEIGHWYLHKDGPYCAFVDTPDSMDIKESYWDHLEFEANRFAHQLLIPKRLILKEGKALIEDFHSQNGPDHKIDEEDFVRSMSRIFEVSGATMRHRLENIGIL